MHMKRLIGLEFKCMFTFTKGAKFQDVSKRASCANAGEQVNNRIKPSEYELLAET